MSVARLCSVNPWPRGRLVVVKCSSTTSPRLMCRRSGSALTCFAYGETTSPPRTWSSVLPSGSRMSAGPTPAGGEITLTLPVARAPLWVVFGGKLPCARPSWLPKQVYQGILSPTAVNGRRAASSSFGIVGNPNSLR